MPKPAFLPGSLVHETDLETDPDTPPPPATSLARYNFVSMRGAVLALNPPESTSIASHPTTWHTSAVQEVVALPRSAFTLRGQLFHSFISYRVTTEGAAGNGMSGLLAEKIRAFSMDRTLELHIPQHGNRVSSILLYLLLPQYPTPLRNHHNALIPLGQVGVSGPRVRRSRCLSGRKRPRFFWTETACRTGRTGLWASCRG